MSVCMLAVSQVLNSLSDSLSCGDESSFVLSIAHQCGIMYIHTYLRKTTTHHDYLPCNSARQSYVMSSSAQTSPHRHAWSKIPALPTWYGDLLRFRRGGAVLVSDSDSDRVGPWTKG